jgi:hypothetical protein
LIAWPGFSQEVVMSPFADRLPDRFPVGTRYVIEGRGREGRLHIHSRYLEFPDGRRVALPVEAPVDAARHRRRRSRRGAARK